MNPYQPNNPKFPTPFNTIKFTILLTKLNRLVDMNE
jgi:hypothetical protein